MNRIGLFDWRPRWNMNRQEGFLHDSPHSPFSRTAIVLPESIHYNSGLLVPSVAMFPWSNDVLPTSCELTPLYVHKSVVKPSKQPEPVFKATCVNLQNVMTLKSTKSRICSVEILRSVFSLTCKAVKLITIYLSLFQQLRASLIPFHGRGCKETPAPWITSSPSRVSWPKFPYRGILRGSPKIRLSCPLYILAEMD